MTWQRVIHLGGVRWGLEYWRLRVARRWQIVLRLFGRALIAEWRWV